MIGAGPNGLAAAILLARAGIAVTVHEAASEIGGGARTSELTLPGFRHDVCSAVYPMGVSSPCFEQFPLARFGLEWVHSPAPLAHPLDDGTAVMLERSIEATAAGLGADGAGWRALIGPVAERWGELRYDVLAPLGMPRQPLWMADFGLSALRSARGLAYDRFQGVRARALFAGIAAHSLLPLDEWTSAAVGMVLGAIGHAAGWPIARGGAAAVSGALGGYLESLGGKIVTDSRVESLPEGPMVFCDLSPRQLLAVGGTRLPAGYRKSLAAYRAGPGVFKMDYALDGPIPWRAAECLRAATVHLGGTLEEIAEWEAHFTGRPFLLLAQQSLFDETRAPAGKHTVWTYCHVPNGSTQDYSAAIEEQIERFAPGFRARILARHALTPAKLEAYNANLTGGDIGGGAMGLVQTFLRPDRHRHRTPAEGVYLCSSSTPPGGGVHGMCGYHAVRAAIPDKLIQHPAV